MSEHSIDEATRKALRQMNITFASFKQVVGALITRGAPTTEDDWVDFFIDFTHSMRRYNYSIEEWAGNYFDFFTIDKNGYELRCKSQEWISCINGPKPEFNVSVLLCLEEDAEPRYVEGMWDISRKWVRIDTYEECNPIYYKYPNPPKD